jgi:ribose 5-phosphate isomerase B
MIAIGCDHGGFEMKEQLKAHLAEEHMEYEDFGTDSPKSVDYPDIAKKVCEAVLSGKCDKGILVCGTGIGMSICANKFDGIRAALCSDCYSAEMTRKHNDTNILCLGGRVIGIELAKLIADIWLSNEFIGSYHQNRLDKIAKVERKENF